MSIDPSKYSTIVNVRNIDDDMTIVQLEELFAKYGTVTSCKILNSGNIGRFAYVAFEDPDAAEEAIIELNGQELTEGKRISLHRTREKIIRQAKHKKNSEISNSTSIINRGEIFVKHLAPEIDENYLRSVFLHCGTIVTAKVIIENGRSKCYGFIGFETPEEANKAVEKMNGRLIIGRAIHVSLSHGIDRSKIAKKKSLNDTIINRGEIFVKNLTPGITPDYLRILFYKCGTIVSAKVIMENGISKGYGFVTFATPEGANNAVEMMNGHDCGGHTGLHVALARGTDRSQKARSEIERYLSQYVTRTNPETGRYRPRPSTSILERLRANLQRSNAESQDPWCSSFD